MPEGIQSSFIPKQNFTNNANSAASRASLGLLMLIAMVIFGLSLVAFAGAYGYQYILSDSINRPCQAGSDQGCGLRESLEHDKRELQVDRIVRFARLDAKMKAASGIINNHATLLPLFDKIQELTLQTIRYTKFDFSDKGITLEGVALGYEDIAVQLKAFKSSDLVNNAVFSGLGLDPKGNITFKLALTVNKDLTSYQALVQQNQAEQQSVINQLPVVNSGASASSTVSATSTNQ
jgi:nitrate reductase NapE component